MTPDPLAADANDDAETYSDKLHDKVVPAVSELVNE
jgi:hypothetical protein